MKKSFFLYPTTGGDIVLSGYPSWVRYSNVYPFKKESSEAKERRLEYQREYQQRPDVKKRRREYQQRPDVKKRQREYNQRYEAKKKRTSS